MKRMQRGLLAAAAIFVAAFVVSVPVMAHNGEDHGTQSDAQRHEKEEERAKKAAELRAQQEKAREALKAKQEELKAKREQIKGKLDEARKKVCSQRSDQIKRIMTQQGTQGQKHLDTFSKIADRVNEFYTSKKLTVANYEQLWNNVAAKKAAAQTAVDAVKSGVNFDCNGDNPVGTADTFKGKVRAMHQALKDYRSSINELIRAVKAVAAEARKEETQ